VHLVIGANSFAGRHAVTALGEHGPVRAVDLGAGLAAAMDGVEVVHVAAPLYSPFDRLAWRARRRGGRPNGFLVELLRLAGKAGVRRVVVMSSTSALGTPRGGRVTERTRPVPEHPYERLLAYDEAWLRDRYDPDVVVLRPAQAFGAGEPVLSYLLDRLLRGWLLRGRLLLPGGGRAWRTFVAGPDLGRAFHAAALRGDPGGAYLVGGLKGSWRELISAVASELHIDAHVNRLPYDLAYLAAWARATSGLPLAQRCWRNPCVVDLFARSQVVEDGWSRRELCWTPEVTSFAGGLAGLGEWVRQSARAGRVKLRTRPGAGARSERLLHG
jgi:nucleoside-diphosphate-sugar epimerase